MAGTATGTGGSARMLGEKIGAGEPLARDQRLAIKEDMARQRGKSSGLRIFILVLAATASVVGVSEGVLALSGDFGSQFTEDLVAGGQD
ncbi:hypothetical protein G7078_07945 [Sphingomonas sinipercae]|uniref:Uncharacterized protein n=1 Tax=Sphingomonas sinipercae TaxID=2714944 RepID=A0A6G7ZP75_9SPHN|nr:hypothetical protein [Sphingomonas sinipercae]QIL02719.1 hypothetical protein G7078_07945 [Sphingomonas sinipercae]